VAAEVSRLALEVEADTTMVRNRTTPDTAGRVDRVASAEMADKADMEECAP